MFFLRSSKKDATATKPANNLSDKRKESQTERRLIVEKTVQQLLSCSRARDARELLADIQKLDLTNVLEKDDFSALFSVLNRFKGDSDITVSILKAFCSVTSDVNGGCEYFFTEVVNWVPELLDCLDTTNRAVQELCLILLNRSVENEYFRLCKFFLSPQLCVSLVTMATDTPSKVQETSLQLLLSLVSSGVELQPLLSRETILKKLVSFAVAMNPSESALQILFHILYQNPEAQSICLSDEISVMIVRLFDPVVDGLKKGWKKKEHVAPDFKVSVNALLIALDIINCFFPSSDAGDHHQDAMKSKVLEPVAVVALSGGAVEDSVRIAALRTLSRLLQNSTECVSTFLGLDVMCVSGGLDSSRKIFIWPGVRSLMENLFLQSCDVSLLDATLSVFQALLSEKSCAKSVIASIFKGTHKRNREAEFKDSGEIFTDLLFGSASQLPCKYYAAHLLRLIVLSPDCAKQLWTVSLRYDDTLSKYNFLPQTDVKKEMMFFDVLMNYTLLSLQGSQRGVDTASLAAYIGTLLVWLEDESVVIQVLAHPEWYKSLAKFASPGTSVHIRLWCGALLVTLYNNAPQSHPSRPLVYEQFKIHLGSAIFFTNILFDLNSVTDEWRSPPTSAFSCRHLVVYDERFVQLIDGCVAKFFNNTDSDTNPSGSLPHGEHVKATNSEETSRLRVKVEEQDLVIASKNEMICDLQKELDTLRRRGDNPIEKVEFQLSAMMSSGTTPCEELREILAALSQRGVIPDGKYQRLLIAVETMEHSPVNKRDGDELEVLRLRQKVSMVEQERDELLTVLGELFTN